MKIELEQEELERIKTAEANGWTHCQKHPFTNVLVGFPPNATNLDSWEPIPPLHWFPKA